jgi:hypothetical protein
VSGLESPPPLRVGIVGYGMMGRAHSYGYRVAPLLRRLPAASGRWVSVAEVISAARPR